MDPQVFLALLTLVDVDGSEARLAVESSEDQAQEAIL